MDWESGVKRRKLLHLEWISNEILLFSTRNYIQSLVMEHVKDNVKKRMYIYACVRVCVCVCVCVCVSRSFCCTVKN